MVLELSFLWSISLTPILEMSTPTNYFLQLFLIFLLFSSFTPKHPFTISYFYKMLLTLLIPLVTTSIVTSYPSLVSTYSTIIWPSTVLSHLIVVLFSLVVLFLCIYLLSERL